jgi:hypothetical protein
MYLTELDPITGLVRITGENDGVMAIGEFRDVINNPDLGIQCFTAIALTADYLTPIRHYHINDRPFKAMEQATRGNRRAFVWDQELIQLALVKYKELQYNPVVEEKVSLDFMLREKMKEITSQKEKNSFVPTEEATMDNIEDLIGEYREIKKLVGDLDWQTFSEKEKQSVIRKANIYVIGPENRTKEDDYRKRDEEKMVDLFKQLNVIKSFVDNFKKENDSNDIYADGPVRNGYKLTRLEEKQLDKNSFYYKGR